MSNLKIKQSVENSIGKEDANNIDYEKIFTWISPYETHEQKDKLINIILELYLIKNSITLEHHQGVILGYNAWYQNRFINKVCCCNNNNDICY